MKPNDTIPNASANDTEPSAAPDAEGSGAEKVDTDPMWPPPSGAAGERAASQTPDDVAPDGLPPENVDWYLDGFRGRPRVQVRRQAESEGLSGAAYDTLAHPAKRVEPATLPDHPVIVASTPTPANATAPTGAGGSPPPPPVVAERMVRRSLTTVPAAHRVRKVKWIVNGVVLVAALFALVAFAAIVTRRRATTGAGPEGVDTRSVEVTPSAPSSSSALETSAPPAPSVEQPSNSSAAIDEPAAPASIAPPPGTAATAPASAPEPSVVSPPALSASTAPSAPASAAPSAPASATLPAPTPKREAPHKNDGERNL